MSWSPSWHLPAPLPQLCKRFLDSPEYKAFLQRKESKPLHVSFFQKRVCSCMVEEKMTQCADSIDTQHNVLLSTWVKSAEEWFKSDTCSKPGCICKETGFFDIKSQRELWAFLFRGECAPKPDLTRRLPRDAVEHTHCYRYGEDEKGAPLAEGHRNDDLLELAAQPVKDLTSYKHYEGGVTVRGVGQETGFAFTRRRLGCYCVPAAGASCCHGAWTGELDRGAVLPVTPARAGGAAAQRVTRQAPRRSGPSAAFREGIDDGSLLCMPGDSDDEAADGEAIWYVNALGPQEKNKDTYQCGPCTLVKNHFSVPIEWLALDELTDEHAIFKVWPTDQDRIAATHLMDMPDLEWDKVEQGRHYMSRAQYDAGNDQL
jgi:hypothetical protein